MSEPISDLGKITVKNLLYSWHASLLKRGDDLLNERRQVLAEAGKIAQIINSLDDEAEAPSEKEGD